MSSFPVSLFHISAYTQKSHGKKPQKISEKPGKGHGAYRGI